MNNQSHENIGSNGLGQRSMDSFYSDESIFQRQSTSQETKLNTKKFLVAYSILLDLVESLAIIGN